MLTRLWIVLSCLPLALLVGCGGGSSAAKCVAGATAECACPAGQQGVQTCNSVGAFGTCACGTTPLADAGGGDGAANRLDTAALGGSGGGGGAVADAAADLGAVSMPDAPAVGGSGGSGGTAGATSSGGTATGGAATSTGGVTSTGGTVVTGGTGASGGVVDGGTTSPAGGTTANGCSTCSIGLVCERYDNACLDPAWAEWPMPNSQADVTAGAPNLESYTDNGDGTVTDNVTGLMWQQVVPSATYTWANAVAYCPTLALAGHSSWRLPSRIELESIVDFGQSSPSINGTYFPSTPKDWFWASSPVAGSPSYAWGVYFFNGSASYGVVSGAGYVRCVR